LEQVDQYDLLRSIDVAIIHCGNGSFKECVARGAPLLAIPFFYDQPSNARIAAERGLGEFIRPGEFDDAAFLAKLNRLANDPSYRANLARAYDAGRDEAEFERAYAAFCERLGVERSEVRAL